MGLRGRELGRYVINVYRKRESFVRALNCVESGILEPLEARRRKKALFLEAVRAAG